jgi:Mce-associated membrane protein
MGSTACWVIAAAAALSVLAAGLGYAVVYRHQQSSEKARAQIAEDGPQIVADILSYTAKTAKDDFAHAQTLVTDAYRPELTQQQEAVQKTGLVDNDYWVSNSAVLSSTQDRAAMLLLLQGQRGVPPSQRFVTASLRVEYEKNRDQWQVSNLTVLTAPKPPAPEPAKPAPPKPDPAKPDPAKPDPAKPDPAKPAPPKPAPAKPGTGGR